MPGYLVSGDNRLELESDGLVSPPAPPKQHWSILYKCLAELVGTAIFVFFGTAVIQSTHGDQDTGAKLTMVALAHGLAIMFLVFAFDPISGGHFNPAVSWGMCLINKQFPVLHFVGYTICQITGAILGVLLLKAIYPASLLRETKYGAHALSPGYTVANGVVLEVVLTFVLVFIIFRVAFDPQTPPAMTPFVIGMTVATDIFIAGRITGASMNPARSFAPALISENAWDNHWIFWVGPLIGATLAALTYKILFSTPKPSKSTDNPGFRIAAYFESNSYINH